MKREIPDLLLEQYRIGEASEDAIRRIEADPDALARVDELNADSNAFFDAYPPEWFVQRIEQQERQTRTAGPTTPTLKESVQSWFDGMKRIVQQPAFVPIVAMAVLGAILVPRMLTEQGFGRDESTDELAAGERMKGLSADLSVYRSNAEGEVEEIEDASTATQGDRLQIAYRAAGARSGVIFSVDGNGTVTLHYPESAIGDATLIQDGEVALPYAYILDDAPFFEQFFFVSGDSEIDPTVVLARAQNAADSVIATEIDGQQRRVDELTARLEDAIQEELLPDEYVDAIAEVTLMKPAPSGITNGDENR